MAQLGGNKKNKKTPIPSPKEWLASDSIYREAVGDVPNWTHALDIDKKTGLVKGQGTIPTAWQSYRDAAQRAILRTKTDYGTGMAQMAKQRSRDINDMGSDFASRGLGQSGLYTDAKVNYNLDYGEQAAAALKAKRRGIQDITTQKQDQRSLVRQQLFNAHNDAVLRRIQKYGLAAPGA
jgi:hypothetical protein